LWNKAPKNNLLLVAPNPATHSTMVYFDCASNNSSSEKTIVVTDLLGRTLQTINLNATKGAINLDCSNYAQGQYMILLKENDTIIENSKLIINK
jgi:hypothetical protein